MSLIEICFLPRSVSPCNSTTNIRKQSHSTTASFWCTVQHNKFLIYLTLNLLDPECWTDWFNKDDPGGSGDWETLSSLQMRYPRKTCPEPVDIEANIVSGLSMDTAGDIIYKSVWKVFKIHCSLWSNACSMPVVVFDGVFLLAFHGSLRCSTRLDTDPVDFYCFSRYEPTVGFICRNLDQQGGACKDYKVRFSCPLPFCGGSTYLLLVTPLYSTVQATIHFSRPVLLLHTVTVFHLLQSAGLSGSTPMTPLGPETGNCWTTTR